MMEFYVEFYFKVRKEWSGDQWDVEKSPESNALAIWSTALWKKLDYYQCVWHLLHKGTYRFIRQWIRQSTDRHRTLWSLQPVCFMRNPALVFPISVGVHLQNVAHHNLWVPRRARRWLTPITHQQMGCTSAWWNSNTNNTTKILLKACRVEAFSAVMTDVMFWRRPQQCLPVNSVLLKLTELIECLHSSKSTVIFSWVMLHFGSCACLCGVAVVVLCLVLPPFCLGFPMLCGFYCFFFPFSALVLSHRGVVDSYSSINTLISLFPWLIYYDSSHSVLCQLSFLFEFVLDFQYWAWYRRIGPQWTLQTWEPWNLLLVLEWVRWLETEPGPLPETLIGSWDLASKGHALYHPVFWRTMLRRIFSFTLPTCALTVADNL